MYLLFFFRKIFHPKNIGILKIVSNFMQSFENLND
jgi:hypothetical protein